ncbi:MAG: phosphate ABC transporter substrate-binding protein PstS [Dehalococcoidia bacterium]|nr:phosphate ABC transporter substrate-binding protein PstS [Dehalococcoidia bacterium]
MTANQRHIRIGRLWGLLSLALAVMLLASCTPAASTSSPTATSGTTPTTAQPAPTGTPSQTRLINGAGATFPYPLYSKLFDEYTKVVPWVRINYQSVGSGAGIQQISQQTVDFGASDAPLTDDQLKAAPAALVHIPMTMGPVVIIYNLQGVSTGLKLTSDVVAGIFLGTITKWNDAKITSQNPGVSLPDQVVTSVHRSDGSGTSAIFTDYLSAIDATWKSTIGKGTSVNWPGGLGAKGNEGVAGQVQQLPGSVGYVELAYAAQNKMPFASIKNKDGNFVAPSLEATTAAAAGSVSTMPDDMRVSIVNASGKDAYPISGYTYIILYQAQTDQAKGKAVVDFLWWATHDGQKFGNALLYSTLPAEVVKKVEAKLKTITYNGKAYIN